MRISCRLMVFALAVASCLAQNPATPVFSGAVATDADLLAAKDLSQSTLTSSITNSTTSVPVADGTQFIAAEVIRIDNEQMLIASIATNTLTVSRAYGGTTAASHLSGAAVRGIITSSHHNQLAAEIKTMQARLRDRSSFATTAGGTTTFTLTLAPPIAAYADGVCFTAKMNATSAANPTLNVNGVGAKAIYQRNGTSAAGAVSTGGLISGQVYPFCYNSSLNSSAGAWETDTGTGSATAITALTGDVTASGPGSAAATAASSITRDAEVQSGVLNYCRSTTGNDTYTCSLTPTLTAYTRGGCLTLDADTANTLAASVNVDSLGAKSILNRAGSSLATGDITANKPITICYDGTQYIIQGDGGGSGSGDALKSEVQSGSYVKCSVGSGGSPYTCTITPPLAAYTDGMAVRFVRTGGTAETGTATLNIDSLGATAIKKHGGTTDPGGFCNIPAGPVSIVLTYNSANSVFWLPPCPGEDNRGDAVSGANLQYGAYTYCTTGGTSTAYTCSLANSLSGGSAPALGAYANGGAFTIKINATSGASPTLNIDSLGAKKIYIKTGRTAATQAAAGDLLINQVYTMHYNSSLDSGSGGFEASTGASVTGLADQIVPSKTSSTISISAGSFRVGESVISVSAATAAIASGTGSGSAIVYITSAGAVVVEHSTAAGLTITCTACTATQVTTPSVPATAVRIADVVITSGTPSTWGTLTDKRALYGRDVLVAGTGMVVTPGSGINTVAIDTADVARQGGTNTFTGANDFSGATSTYPMKVATSDPGTCSVGMFLFRSDTGATKACTATNTWTAIGGGGATAVYVDMPAGGCTHGATTREMWWDAAALVCLDATNNIGFIGVYQNAPLGTAHMIIPYGWTSGTIDITLPVVEGSSAGLSHTMTVATACPGTGDLRAITFGATQTISWTSTATNTTQYVTKTGVTVPGTCAAGQPMLFQFIRTDTAGAYTYFLGAVAKVNIP